MYLVAIHVPVFVEGSELSVATDWKRSIELLVDSLAGRLGPVCLLAPSIPLSEAPPIHLERLNPEPGRLDVVASLDPRGSASHFWRHGRRRWRSDLEPLVARARVVHSGLADLYKPLNFMSHLCGLRHAKATVFVRDTDSVLQERELRAQWSLRRRLQSRLHVPAVHRCMLHGVRTASLSLLKGRTLMERYGSLAANAKLFQDTSHRSDEVVESERVEARLSSLTSGRPFRLVYCGRLVPRKGVDEAIQIVAKAGRKGADVKFDVIGDGSERKRLEILAEESGVGPRVQFLGHRRYGRELIAELADYDALFFTPKSEDTPRMIFDAFAAGLPVLGYDIAYLRERADEEGAVQLLPKGRIETSAKDLADLTQDLEKVRKLTRAALQAGHHHAADRWYQRRAEWTLEAVERFEASRR